jgi:hypothetical protein
MGKIRINLLVLNTVALKALLSWQPAQQNNNTVFQTAAQARVKSKSPWILLRGFLVGMRGHIRLTFIFLRP